MHTNKFARFVFIISIFGLVSSCNQDKEELRLIEQQKQQEAEITAYEAKVATLKAELTAKKIKDPAPEIAGFEAKLAATTSEIESYEEDIASLEIEKKTLSEEFDAYRKKYPIRKK